MEYDDDRFLSDYEAASQLGISTDEIEEIRRRGLIRASLLSSGWWSPRARYLYDAESILAYQEGLPDAPASIIETADAILSRALECDASEVHIEPGKTGVRVRFRTDGALNEVTTLPVRFEKPLTHRFLIMADAPRPLSLSVAQTGVIKRDWNEREYRFALSSVPVRYGPIGAGAKLLIRIPPRAAALTGSQLGLTASQTSQVQELLSASVTGLTLFASPRGEGLSALIRYAMHTVNQPTKNLYILGDTGDFSMDGVSCITLDPAIGMTASIALRAAVRQNANLIIFPEITDSETAQVAAEAAAGGLSVWAGAGVAGFDMAGTPGEAVQILRTRFQSLGIAPERFDSVVRGAVMSRRVRTLCPDCKESIPVTEWEVSEMAARGLVPPPEAYQAKGCARCRETGYGGGTGLFALYRAKPLGGDGGFSFAQGAVALFASGETDAAELRRLRVWPER